jgi:hypothetical protein
VLKKPQLWQKPLHWHCSITINKARLTAVKRGFLARDLLVFAKMRGNSPWP